MAKKRDHKVLITDEAIKKVPLVQYKEIPESEYLMLQELAREVLIVSKMIMIPMKLHLHTALIIVI